MPCRIPLLLGKSSIHFPGNKFEAMMKEAKTFLSSNLRNFHANKTSKSSLSSLLQIVMYDSGRKAKTKLPLGGRIIIKIS
jgi:hypothetical protein